MKIQHPSFDLIYTTENLYHAWHKVSLGKSSKSSIVNFYQTLDKNLASIAYDLKNNTYKPGPYNHFLVKDPKERLIAASPVRDRIVQHALMNYYDIIFDRHLIFDSYACRIGKGTHKAVLRAFHFAKSSSVLKDTIYFLKMDVRKYFDSINHEVLKILLSKIIKDKNVLNLFYTIINSGDILSGKGIPIGNLTSQYFANYYLSGFDHYFKENLHIKRYIRYMDDIIVFTENKNDIKGIYEKAVCYADEKLRLTLKPQISGSINDGVPFLGFLVKPAGIYLQKKTKRRYKARIAEIEYKKKTGKITELDAGCRAESVTAHLLIARSKNFRNNVLHGRALWD
ncbi:MAG: reverse transcriptase/maturase family protein [Treponema sp.]|nr:reverse transcriptase/maturase family protein [Treponema sp.]